MSSKKDFKGD